MRPYRLLYIDDEVDNLNVFEVSFKNDFHITTCISAKDGLTRLEQESFDIIISDQRMPGISGVEFLEKASTTSPASIRILLTGYADMNAIIDAINKGRIFYYCTKPWKKDELRIVFLKAIEHYQLVKQNQELIHKLTRSVKELETFLYRASHDLKSPITSQLGLLNLLKLEVNEAGGQYVQKLEESIILLEKTITQIQTLSAIGYDVLRENFHIPLDDLVTVFVQQHQELIDAQQVTLIKQYPPELSLQGSRDILLSIITNILENSLLYTGHHAPIISISAEASKRQGVLITITDNGRGIPPEVQPSIFQPFFRGDASSSGSGLGLYIVKKMVDLMDGQIHISSVRGEGTVIQLELPGHA